MEEMKWQLKRFNQLLAAAFWLGCGLGVANAGFSIGLDSDESDEQDYEDAMEEGRLNDARKLGVHVQEVETALEKRRQEELARARREAERREREEQVRLAQEAAERAAERAAEEAQLAAEGNQRRYDASGNKGGSLSCQYVASDSALWNYCNRGACDGFSNNYGLYHLCNNNSPSGFASNYGVYDYLVNGNPYGLSGYNAQQGAKNNSGSFSDRKRFIIYHLRGYVYGHY